MVKIHKFCIIFALCIACKCNLSTPNAFVDTISGSATLTNLRNIPTGYAGELHSGFVTGTFPDGAVGVKVAVDEGPFKLAITAGSKWKFPLPTGAEAAAGVGRWQPGTKHRLRVRLVHPNGNALAETINVTFTRRTNRDVNGDGYGDIAVGAYTRDAGLGASQGAAYIFHGSASGVSSQAAANANTVLTGQAAGDNFGYSLSLGDIDGDGYADLAVGAHVRNTQTGAVYVFHGSSSGIASQGAAGARQIYNGETTLNQFGGALAMGDFNGDGYDDLVAAARIRNAGAGANQGVAYLFLGSTSGLPNVLVAAASAVLSGQAASYFFGTAIATGDVNGDGFADLAITGNGAGQGAVFVFHGSASGVASQTSASANAVVTGQGASDSFGGFANLGDVNGDGYSDLVVSATNRDAGAGAGQGTVYIFHSSASGIASSLAANANTILTGQAVDNFGTALSTNDMNGDGYADLAVGAKIRDAGAGTNQGTTYIFRGAATGIATQSAASAQTILTGQAASDVFGYSASFVDVNGDGYPDLAVGAFSRNAGAGAIQGVTHIFHSSAAGISSQNAANANAALAGQAAGDRFGNAIAMLRRILSHG